MITGIAVPANSRLREWLDAVTNGEWLDASARMLE
jgi:hypothetical protein